MLCGAAALRPLYRADRRGLLPARACDRRRSGLDDVPARPARSFIVVELISNNVVEPWLYGASTGLSPIAIIAAAVFWTWLWGPIGLLLSTPLTVCLVVLGRHVPQLAFLDVLLGNEPVLTPPELLYQRLLVGDPNEATERAEEYLREHSLADFYDEVAIPALALAEEDRSDGRLSRGAARPRRATAR